MSHGKSMDIETVFETCLIDFQPIRGTDLFKKIRERGYDLSRAQLYRYARKLKKLGKLEQRNGIWYYTKLPQPKKATKELTDREAAIRYFQWRGSPKGGNVPFYKAIFGEPEK
jgi:hypothetical protein